MKWDGETGCGCGVFHFKLGRGTQPKQSCLPPMSGSTLSSYKAAAAATQTGPWSIRALMARGSVTDGLTRISDRKLGNACRVFFFFLETPEVSVSRLMEKPKQSDFITLPFAAQQSGHFPHQWRHKGQGNVTFEFWTFHQKQLSARLEKLSLLFSFFQGLFKKWLLQV